MEGRTIGQVDDWVSGWRGRGKTGLAGRLVGGWVTETAMGVAVLNPVKRGPN